MSIFDKYVLKKENILKKRIAIDSLLYEKLMELSNNVYDASINKLVNIAIIDLIKTKNVNLYERPEIEMSEQHNFLIRESSYMELENLKSKYNISIYKLINIAIYNAIK